MITATLCIVKRRLELIAEPILVVDCCHLINYNLCVCVWPITLIVYLLNEVNIFINYFFSSSSTHTLLNVSISLFHSFKLFSLCFHFFFFFVFFSSSDMQLIDGQLTWNTSFNYLLNINDVRFILLLWWCFSFSPKIFNHHFKCFFCTLFNQVCLFFFFFIFSLSN